MGRVVSNIPNEDPERVARVLDAKWRTIGVDVDALAQQVAERKAAEAAEKERDRAHAQLGQYFDDQLSLQQQEADLLRKTYNRDVDEFRKENQLKSTRREWDINRPDGKLVDVPGRIGDDDGRVGPSSMQKFDGEDLAIGDRTGQQAAQAKDWWDEQAAHKAAARKAEQDAEAAYAELVRWQDELQREAAQAELHTRKALYKNTEDYNKYLAEEARRRKADQRSSEQQANNAEMEATITSQFMSEDPSLAASAISTTRVRKDHFKGMTEAERRAILATQLAQMEEAKARRAAVAAEEARYARGQQDIRHALDEQSARVDEFKKQQALRAQDILRAQQAEKGERDKGLNDLYRNKIAPEYFAQYGTSHR